MIALLIIGGMVVGSAVTVAGIAIGRRASQADDRRRIESLRRKPR